ncbi:MAG: DUF4331 domain-containing protein [Actinomycetes bacterium]
MTSNPRASRARRAGAVLAASAVAASGAALLGAGTGTASSHREAPLISNDPTADNTDTYAFVSPDDPDSVTLIANWFPFQEPAGGPNFYPWATDDQARYNIKIDNNGDAVEDITYQWTFQTIDNRATPEYPPPGPQADGSFLYNNGPVTSFDDPTLLFKQTYTLTEIDGDGNETVLVEGAPVAPSRVGDASMPDYQALRDEAVVSVEDGTGTSFVGQSDDPFFLDLRIFDLLYGGDLSEVGNDTLACFNVNSVALQLPIADFTAGDDPVIGVWSTTDRRSMRVQAADGTQTYDGDFVQVSRLGNPLVNEVVIPAYLKDAFNAVPPVADATIPEVVDKVLYPEVPYLVEAIYGIPAPETPRTDLKAIFLTGLNGLNQPANVVPSEQLRLNTSIPPADEPSRLGVLAGDNAGFPNGRRLADDVVDIELQALEGAVTVDETGAPTGVTIVEALAAGDVVNKNDYAFGDEFPYLALPTSGSDADCGKTAAPPPTEPPTEPPTTDPVPTDPPDTGAAAGDTGSLPLLPLGAATIALAGLGYAAVSLRKQRAATGS